jgi:hypothetical protein
LNCKWDSSVSHYLLSFGFFSCSKNFLQKPRPKKPKVEKKCRPKQTTRVHF